MTPAIHDLQRQTPHAGEGRSSLRPPIRSQQVAPLPTRTWRHKTGGSRSASCDLASQGSSRGALRLLRSSRSALTRPDRYAAGASRSSGNPTPAARANPCATACNNNAIHHVSARFRERVCRRFVNLQSRRTFFLPRVRRTNNQRES